MGVSLSLIYIISSRAYTIFTNSMVLPPSCIFLQYYRRGTTYMTKYYFLRRKQESIIDIDVCHPDDDSEFCTGYDHLVA
ncbi:RteC domain-containing protein [Bacteroides fragilis]|nr:RteC domain-containing protein [Bacteroides fragilis]